MSIMTRAVAALVLLATLPSISLAQSADGKPPMALVAIYHVAPGKHVEFLKWMAAREAIDKEVGIPATQWYAHMDGDSWDYVGVGPKVSDEDSKKAEAAAKKKGLTVGMKAGIEFRALVSSHTDTFAVGPTTATELVEKATGK